MDFIDSLLTVDLTKRLGSGGSKDVRAHPWMKAVDFKSLDAKKLNAPFVPTIKSPTDDSNFDEFDDEGKIRWAQEDFPRDMFKDFSEEWVGEEA